jgi:hypothetical protein
MSPASGFQRVVAMSSAFRIAASLCVMASTSAAAQFPKVGSTVRVTTAAGETTGKLIGVDSALMYIATPRNDRVDFARTRITKLEVRGHHAKDGAAIVGFTAAAFGVAYVVALEGDCEVASSCKNGKVPGVMLHAALILGGTGATVGALIGRLIPRWTPADLR